VTASIYGVGTSHFGKQPGLLPKDLAWTAIAEALADAETDNVDAVYVGTVFGAPGVAQRALHAFGITDIPILTIENACASGTSAFHEAVTAVESGRYERVLALGVEHMSSTFAGPILPELTDAEGRAGLALPALYAMAASRYLALGAVTEKQLAEVAVKNHRHALGNPRAQYRGDYSIDEILGSAMISDPLTLLQCCPLSDGAGAAVVGPPRHHARDIPVLASVLKSGGLWDYRSNDVWGFQLVRDTARAAYEKAGIGVADATVFEVHDAFTIGEIATTEALGLAETGGGGELVSSGQTTIGGRTPVNPSGGLLSRGHPLGATGLAQIAEIVWQLRGDAGERQVEQPRVGVVETMGGGVSGIDGNACVVAVLGG
jgi:acetyl-CoA acetyltransferase